MHYTHYEKDCKKKMIGTGILREGELQEAGVMFCAVFFEWKVWA